MLGSEESNRANNVKTMKATGRSAPAPGTSATIMPKDPTVSTSKVSIWNFYCNYVNCNYS